MVSLTSINIGMNQRMKGLFTGSKGRDGKTCMHTVKYIHRDMKCTFTQSFKHNLYHTSKTNQNTKR